jgi:hypothetical protein
MPYSERQRSFMQAEYGRKKSGKATKTGMSLNQLKEHSTGRLKKSKKNNPYRAMRES